jgi:hypothetical protein
MVRHEALVFRMGVKDHPSFRRRSDGMKLEEVQSGDRRGGREQPRRSCVGPELPDGSGAVSETGRYMRRTGYVTPLDSSPALTRWIRAGFAVRTRPSVLGSGNFRSGLVGLGLEAMVNGLRQ